MNNIPFISIIIPTYNRATFLPKAILSVINQTYTNWDLIVIDDGSTDNTKEIVKGFIEKDNRIKYFHQNNQERSTARNNGISKANGEYICFLDSDDVYLPNHLEVFNTFIKTNDYPVGIIYAKKTEVNNFNKFEQILKIVIHSQHVCIHKTILEKHKFNHSLKIAEDIDLWMRIIKDFPLLHININTVNIIEHNDRTVNIMKTNFYKYTLDVIKNVMMDPQIKQAVSKSIIRESYSNCLLGSAKYYILKNQREKAAVNLIQSIIYKPTYQLKYKTYLLLSLIPFIKRTFKLSYDF